MYVIKQPTGFVPYFLSGFGRDGADEWVGRAAYAKTFRTADEARKVIAQIERRRGRPPVNPMEVAYVPDSKPQQPPAPEGRGPSLRLMMQGRRR